MMLTGAVKHDKVSFILPNQTCQRLTLAEIELATNNFDEALVIGSGGFGQFTYAELLSATNSCNDEEFSIYQSKTIFKGWVDELTYAPTEPGVGLAMYVKARHIGTSKLDLKSKEFNHPNLAKLIGYYFDEQLQHLSCVYELTPSLDKLLFGEAGTTSLSWVARLKIALGAAQGLSFLHKKGHPAYSQFKTACILVDTDYNARLWDFEVDSSFVVALDSYSFEMDAHYAAPEWFRYQADVMFEGVGIGHYYEYNFGVKSEIYSFGVILLEILTGMKVFDPNRPEGKENLVKWATPLLPHEENLEMILDPKLQENNNPPKGAFMLAQLVSNCLQPTQDKRPSIETILQLDLKSEEFNHPNLVKLIGYYLNEQDLYCVYELNPSTTSLSWAARLKIAVGAAQGLSFLHKKGHPAYSQFKTTCIMVDADYNARLWDFDTENSYLALDSYSFDMDAYYSAPEWFRYQADVILEGNNIEHPDKH
ncbi:hypothetical protein M8C21_026686, partial [Ambrosia artemisiifolia]